MVKPGNFIINSNYATLKNDASSSVTVTIPASQNIPASLTAAGSSADYTTDVAIGQPGALTRTQVASSKDSNIYRAARVVRFARSGTVLGSPAGYDVTVFAYRLNSTTIRCIAHILNPYSEVLTTASGAETISFDIATFLPPF